MCITAALFPASILKSKTIVKLLMLNQHLTKYEGEYHFQFVESHPWEKGFGFPHLAWIFHHLHSERKQNIDILLTVPKEMVFKLCFCFSSGEPNSCVLFVWKKKHSVIGLRSLEDKDHRTGLGFICLAPSPALQPVVEKESSRISSVSLYSGFLQLLQKS